MSPGCCSSRVTCPLVCTQAAVSVRRSRLQPPLFCSHVCLHTCCTAWHIYVTHLPADGCVLMGWQMPLMTACFPEKWRSWERRFAAKHDVAGEMIRGLVMSHRAATHLWGCIHGSEHAAEARRMLEVLSNVSGKCHPIEGLSDISTIFLGVPAGHILCPQPSYQV